MKNHSANTLAIAAAFAGLLGGTTARLNAQPAQQGSTSCGDCIPQRRRAARRSEPANPGYNQALLQRQERLQGPGRRPKTQARTLAKARAAAPLTGPHLRRLASSGVCWRLAIASSLQLSLFRQEQELMMPANRFNAFTDYGVGIGLRVPHYDHILSREAARRLV